ncbi:MULTISPECIES: LLM class flavin-dependent oxidoreductase [unclassified Rhodococcus (in: high G+C Gram-positive bacteria)]|uniref:LLM class flavin-dependent oxidoreductase n=1 Tax=unclassified Rhodococcus (in: high G+C Gram-positive bacteria) TaxID=192944 RepID=UPI00163B4013|nr:MULTISPECIES: LLM class flavin-dependent oxidoreductase [unclassified Rhodococcus (in: high G+C Gram-positive bacteria)]MBC2641814.1 LLM class flavin-dependent oxidoreductase [Rhodococcus sp. 3A]MBC2893442.1 LLM class flavin-dependent oxidoreductase [Rhodococcus sp. 4CII]
MTSAVPRLGVTFIPTIEPERLRDFARVAEESGLDEIWLWEDCFKESGIASAAAALAWTERIRVGVGLMPVPLRNVALTAMEIATLSRLFPGRVIAGVGHGVQRWMEQVGARAASPMTLLEEYTVALRALLDGQTVSTQGRYVRLDGVKLDWPPTERVPLMLGGEGPKSIRLAARLGDGNLVTSAVSDDDIRDTRDLIVEEIGVDGASSHPMVVPKIAATGDGAQRRVDEEVARWEKPVDAGIGVAGDADTIAAEVRRLAGLGATSVAIAPTEDEPDLLGFVKFLGRSVRPLLRT